MTDHELADWVANFLDWEDWPEDWIVDANADYLVLVKVRSWDSGMQGRFAAFLAELWRAKNRIGVVHIQYEPGDYSRACHAVLTNTK